MSDHLRLLCFLARHLRYAIRVLSIVSDSAISADGAMPVSTDSDAISQ
jgi:hypothetical protein